LLSLRSHCLLLTVAASTCVIAFVQPLPAAKLMSRQRIDTTIEGQKVVVTLDVRQASQCPDAQSLWWGVENKCPQETVGSIKVLHGQQSAVIPISSYSDLSSVSKIELTPLVSGFALTIRGGDAATGYVAVLEFSVANKKGIPVLRSRSVTSSPNPKERYERFEYHFPDPDADYSIEPTVVDW
jgi:hypothetical protein